MIELDKSEILLKIGGNSKSPQNSEFFYCPACREFVSAGDSFPSLENQTKESQTKESQTEHSDHALAWLPALDSPLPPYPVEGLVQRWLLLYGPQLRRARQVELSRLAQTTTSSNWFRLLNGEEQEDWQAFLQGYLERLANAWLGALNSQASAFFPEPASLWRNRPGGRARQFWQFEWARPNIQDSSDLLNQINPAP